MKQVLFLGVLAAFLPALLLIGTGSAFAQAAQTPLGTFAFSTSTPVPATATQTALPPCAQSINNLSGLDPNWLASCGHCVSTATPTSQYVIGTAIPTGAGGTPTPTSELPTATATPEGAQLVIEYLDGVSHDWDHGGGQFWLSGDIYYDSEIVGHKVGFVYQTTGTAGSCQFKRSSSNIWTDTSDGVPPGGFDGRRFISIPDVYSIVWWHAGINPFSSNEAMDVWIDEKLGADVLRYSPGALILGPETSNVWARWDLGWNCAGSISVNAIAIVGYGELEEQAPPENMSCTEPAYRDETPIVSYGGFQQLGGTCYTLIPGFSFTIPSIFGLTEEFTLGADTYQLCVQWYSFPELAILTLEIPLDLVILPAAVWLFRRFMEL